MNPFSRIFNFLGGRKFAEAENQDDLIDLSKVPVKKGTVYSFDGLPEVEILWQNGPAEFAFIEWIATYWEGPEVYDPSQYKIDTLKENIARHLAEQLDFRKQEKSTLVKTIFAIGPFTCTLFRYPGLNGVHGADAGNCYRYEGWEAVITVEVLTVAIAIDRLNTQWLFAEQSHNNCFDL